MGGQYPFALGVFREAMLPRLKKKKWVIGVHENFWKVKKILYKKHVETKKNRSYFYPKKFDQPKHIFLAKIMTENGFSDLSSSYVEYIFEHYMSNP